MSVLKESYWPATHEIALRQTTCGGVLREAAACAPQHTALIDAVRSPELRRRWSYAELLAAAEATARAIDAAFPPGAHIAVWASNSPEWVVLQFGLALAGRVMVTVNPAYRPAELAYVLRQSRACGIFHQSHYRGTLLRAAIDEARARETLTLEHIVRLDELTAFVTAHDHAAALPVVQPSDPVMIQYTSGTTGQPKGALLNHYSVTNNARMMALLKNMDARTVNLAVAPLFHTGGCVGGVLGSVQTGGTLLLPPEFDAESMLDLIEEEGATYTFAVPTMLIAMLAAQAHRPRDLTSLRTVFSGGATVPIDVVRQVEAAFGATLIIGYGQTETSPAITHTRPEDDARDKSETIGRALPEVEIKIIDPVTGSTVPLDQPGELCTRGFLVMMGYYEMPEATAATIDAEGWLHTGDLCTMDERGFCRITGRLKDMLIRGGENIYPREIEEVLYTHPAIADVAVLGLSDDYWGEVVGAVVTLKPGQSTSAEELRRFCGGHLARHKLPAHCFALNEMPTTTSGKLQKFKLAAMYQAGELESYRL